MNCTLQQYRIKVNIIESNPSGYVHINPRKIVFPISKSVIDCRDIPIILCFKNSVWKNRSSEPYYKRYEIGDKHKITGLKK